MITKIYSIFFFSEILGFNNFSFSFDSYKIFFFDLLISNKNIVLIVSIIIVILGIAFVKLLDNSI